MICISWKNDVPALVECSELYLQECQMKVDLTLLLCSQQWQRWEGRKKWTLECNQPFTLGEGKLSCPSGFRILPTPSQKLSWSLLSPLPGYLWLSLILISPAQCWGWLSWPALAYNWGDGWTSLMGSPTSDVSIKPVYWLGVLHCTIAGVLRNSWSQSPVLWMPSSQKLREETKLWAMSPSPGASCAGQGSKHFSKISAWSPAPGKAQEGQDYKNALKKIHNIKSLVWLSWFLVALSVPTSFYLSSLKPRIQTESLSNRHRNEDHRNDQVGSELWFINCLWGMRLTQCSVSACGKHSDEPPGASFKSVSCQESCRKTAFCPRPCPSLGEGHQHQQWWIKVCL